MKTLWLGQLELLFLLSGNLAHFYCVLKDSDVSVSKAKISYSSREFKDEKGTDFYGQSILIDSQYQASRQRLSNSTMFDKNVWVYAWPDKKVVAVFTLETNYPSVSDNPSWKFAKTDGKTDG